MNEVCHTMQEGEILNSSQTQYPLFVAVLYGDKVSTKKFSKRLNCSIKHLPLRLSVHFEYDTFKAVKAGIVKDPSLVLEGEIFIEGLTQAEEISEAFEKWLKESK